MDEPEAAPNASFSLAAPLVLSLCLVASPALGQETASAAAASEGPVSGQAAIAGTVVSRETGEPVENALVVIPSLAVGTYSGEDGAFAMGNLPAGDYEVEVRFLGRVSARRPVTLIRQAVSRLSLSVESEPAELPELTVKVRKPISTGKLGQFFIRRETMAGGHFLTRSEIEESNPQELTDAVRRVPGVRVTGNRGNFTIKMARDFKTFSGTVTCPVQYYVDGARQQIDERMNINTLFHPDDIAAIEVYPSPASVPAQFSGANAKCGVMVIWTRDGTE